MSTSPSRRGWTRSSKRATLLHQESEVLVRETTTAWLMLALLASCVECSASACGVVALLYAAFTGFFRVGLRGQTVSGWSLAMAVISTLQLLA